MHLSLYSLVYKKIIREQNTKSNENYISNISIDKCIVTYKYTATMTLIKKPARAFINSLLEKVDKYAAAKLELHVCPFLEIDNYYVYQPVFDFDKGVSKSEITKFINRELKPYINESLIYVELSGDGYHVVCYTTYGLLTKDNIDRMRSLCSEIYKEWYPHLDVVTSMRLMPIRRTPSIIKKHNVIRRVYPVSFKKFKTMTEKQLLELQKKKLILSHEETKSIIIGKIIPISSKIIDISKTNKLPFFLKMI